MIKVEVSSDGSKGLIMDLITFFKMSYPLDYQPILREMNFKSEEDQCLLFHDSNEIEKFIKKFESPICIAKFIEESGSDKKIKKIIIEDVAHVAIDGIIYTFFEECG